MTTFIGGNPKQRLQVTNAMTVLGPRFKARRVYIPAAGRPSIEVVEGDNETVYRIDARNVEQMCGMLLKKVFEDKAQAVRDLPHPDGPVLRFSSSTPITEELEEVIKEMKDWALKI